MQEHLTAHTAQAGADRFVDFDRRRPGVGSVRSWSLRSAAFCCATLGITPTVRHADYIGSWLEVLREDAKAIVRAASAASKAADYLLAFPPGADQLGSSDRR